MNIKHKHLNRYPYRHFGVKHLWILIALLFYQQHSFGQQNNTSKTQLILLDSIGNPISNASVSHRGKGIIATSDAEGKFYLNLPEKSLIKISHINFVSTEYTILDTDPDQLYKVILTDKPQFLNVISVTASAVPRELKKVSSSVSILQKGAPELKQIQTLDEALSYIPGVQVDRSRGLTTTGIHTGVTLRGTGATNRTLVLKDGVPINDSYTGGVSEWNSIATNSIERIEVVRGPGSSIYGSNSMGGTINIVTQKPTDVTTLAADFRYGSMNTYQAGMLYAKRFAKRFGVLLSTEYKETSGYQFLDDSLWKDFYKKPTNSLLNINGKLSYDFENAGSLTATADFNKQDPLSGTTTLFNEWATSGNYQLRYQNTKAKFAPDIIAYYNVQLRKTTSTPYNEISKDFDKVNYFTYVPLDTYGIIAKVSHSIWNNDITIGTDLRFTEIVSNKDYLEKGVQNFTGRQDFISFFINDDLSITNNLHANLGLRLDSWSNRKGYFFDNQSKEDIEIKYDSKNSTVLTPKIGLTYNIVENLRLRSIYAMGFKAPSSFYMYNAAPLGNSFRLGNPALKPERMRYSMEIGADFQLKDKLEISATIYKSQYSDFHSAILIESTAVPSYFDPGKLPVLHYSNIGKVNLWGIETSAKYKLTQFITTQLSYFHNESKIKKYEPQPSYEGKEMDKNPRNIASGALIYNNQKIGHISIWARHTGSYFGDLQNNKENIRDAVTLLDLKLAKTIGPVGLNLTINNLTNKLYYGSYTSPTSYYYGPRLNALFGVNYKL